MHGKQRQVFGGESGMAFNPGPRGRAKNTSASLLGRVVVLLIGLLCAAWWHVDSCPHPGSVGPRVRRVERSERVQIAPRRGEAAAWRIQPARREQPAARRDIPAGYAAEDTQWRTPYFVVDTGKEGVSMFISAAIHGYEWAGAMAAAQIRHWPIRRGRLVVLPRANKLGVEQNVRSTPGWDEPGDLNRAFARAKDRQDQPRGPLAVAIWKLVRQVDPDWVVDLHEGRDYRASGSSSVGNSLIFQRGSHLTPIARRMVADANAKVEDPEQQRFVLLQSSGGADGSLIKAARERLGKHAMIIETTHRGGKVAVSLRARHQRILMSWLMQEVGMLEESAVDLVAPPVDMQGERRWIAIYDQLPDTRRITSRREHRQRRQRVGEAEDIIGQFETVVRCYLGPEDVRQARRLPFLAVILAGPRHHIPADVHQTLRASDVPLLWLESPDDAHRVRTRLRRLMEAAAPAGVGVRPCDEWDQWPAQLNGAVPIARAHGVRTRSELGGRFSRGKDKTDPEGEASMLVYTSMPLDAVQSPPQLAMNRPVIPEPVLIEQRHLSLPPRTEPLWWSRHTAKQTPSSLPGW